MCTLNISDMVYNNKTQLLDILHSLMTAMDVMTAMNTHLGHKCCHKLECFVLSFFIWE